MPYKLSIFWVLFLFITVFPGCKNWHTLQLETQDQPVQFGAYSIASAVDTLGTVTAFTKYDVQDETYSASENVYVEIGGGEYFEENLKQTIYQALEYDPKNFIANGQVVVEVKHGISLGAVLAGLFANMLTGPNSESEVGTYSEEHIYYHGVVYKIKAAYNSND